jgi:queuine/archaeosine tRNA-ribosyltransferase
MMRLMRRLRNAIAEGVLPQFVAEFMLLQVLVNA